MTKENNVGSTIIENAFELNIIISNGDLLAVKNKAYSLIISNNVDEEYY
jgi:hypothetical protein